MKRRITAKIRYTVILAISALVLSSCSFGSYDDDPITVHVEKAPGDASSDQGSQNDSKTSPEDSESSNSVSSSDKNSSDDVSESPKDSDQDLDDQDEDIENQDSEDQDQVSDEDSEDTEAEEDTDDSSDISEVDTSGYNDPDFQRAFTTQESYEPNLDIDALSTEEESWSFKRNSDHTPVIGYYSVDLDAYGAYFRNQEAEDEKVVYLTFDEGYENGYTSTILDILKDNGVNATFFVTGTYLKSDPDLVERMTEEGNLVGNHSETHPEFSTLTDEEVQEEITEPAEQYESITGKTMDPFFRPPEGIYTERTLYLTRQLGYRSIFWSMAYEDWDTSNQPGADVAYNHVMTNYHNGAIILLHAVSESNTEALDDIIKSLKEEGYRFGSLYELE